MENQQHCLLGVRNGIEDHWLGEISGVYLSCRDTTAELGKRLQNAQRNNQAAGVEQ
jgi:ethanolamine ammonia-lyase large subunit